MLVLPVKPFYTKGVWATKPKYQSHILFPAQCFLRRSFYENDNVVRCSSSFHSIGINCLLSLSYYSTILAGNTFASCPTSLPDACDLVFCSGLTTKNSTQLYCKAAGRGEIVVRVWRDDRQTIGPHCPNAGRWVLLMKQLRSVEFATLGFSRSQQK